MVKNELALLREIIERGFFYDNLKKMAEICRNESTTSRLVASYVLCSIFSDFADTVEASPYKEIQERLETKYKQIIKSLLDKVLSGASLEDQFEALNELIKLYWGNGGPREA